MKYFFCLGVFFSFGSCIGMHVHLNPSTNNTQGILVTLRKTYVTTVAWNDIGYNNNTDTFSLRNLVAQINAGFLSKIETIRNDKTIPEKDCKECVKWYEEIHEAFQQSYQIINGRCEYRFEYGVRIVYFGKELSTFANSDRIKIQPHGNRSKRPDKLALCIPDGHFDTWPEKIKQRRERRQQEARKALMFISVATVFLVIVGGVVLSWPNIKKLMNSQPS